MKHLDNEGINKYKQIESINKLKAWKIIYGIYITTKDLTLECIKHTSISVRIGNNAKIEV